MFFFHSRRYYDKFDTWSMIEPVFLWVLVTSKYKIPDKKLLKVIADVYDIYKEKINEKLKEQIKRICPVLIKGYLDEGKQNAVSWEVWENS